MFGLHFGRFFTYVLIWSPWTQQPAILVFLPITVYASFIYTAATSPLGERFQLYVCQVSTLSLNFANDFANHSATYWTVIALAEMKSGKCRGYAFYIRGTFWTGWQDLGDFSPVGRLFTLCSFCWAKLNQRMLLSTPTPQFGNDCKQASLFHKTNKYFHTKKNDTCYHKALSLLCAQHRLPQSSLQHNFTF
jgi:hypothetical protein